MGKGVQIEAGIVHFVYKCKARILGQSPDVTTPEDIRKKWTYKASPGTALALHCDALPV